MKYSRILEVFLYERLKFAPIFLSVYNTGKWSNSCSGSNVLKILEDYYG